MRIAEAGSPTEARLLQLPVATCSKYWGGLLLVFPIVPQSVSAYTDDHATRGTNTLILPPLWQLKGFFFKLCFLVVFWFGWVWVFFNYGHGVSTIQALCPVTDPGPLAFHFTLHDPTQTSTYICALWIFPVTVCGSSCLLVTHTLRHKPADGSEVEH